MFKSIQYKLYIFTLLLTAAVSGTTLLLVYGKYIFVLPGLILIFICFFQLKECYSRYNLNIIFLLNALENGDYTYRFSERKSSTREREMNKTFNRIKEILENARKEVIENEQFLSLILESVSTGIIIVDDSGIVRKVNRTALEMLGLPIFTHLKQLQAVDEMYPELFRNLKPGDSRQLALTSEKEEFPVSLRVSHIKLKRGMMRVMTLNNIGNELEMKEMESWTRLIRVMTHEIMNSIAPITSLSETMTFVLKDLKDLKDFNELKANSLEAFETINTTASGLLSFVDSYRKFTSVPKPKKERFDLSALIEKVVKLHEQAIREKNIKVRLPAGEPVFAVADENLIRQVLTNLVRNAIEAAETTDNERIEITIRRQEAGNITLDIANTGKPIPPEVLPHIFVPFFTTKPNGSGIGLSVSRYIMRLHGGKLLHFVSPDQLTVFQLAIPMK
ncbi:sensor histidine kinase [Bacteroidia bacterium]|nr:sensor histidine kinase [Bacteroidia bacterium]